VKQGQQGELEGWGLHWVSGGFPRKLWLMTSGCGGILQVEG